MTNILSQSISRYVDHLLDLGDEIIHAEAAEQFISNNGDQESGAGTDQGIRAGRALRRPSRSGHCRRRSDQAAQGLRLGRPADRSGLQGRQHLQRHRGARGLRRGPRDTASVNGVNRHHDRSGNCAGRSMIAAGIDWDFR